MAEQVRPVRLSPSSITDRELGETRKVMLIPADAAELKIALILNEKNDMMQRIRDIINQSMKNVRPDVHASFPKDQWELIVNSIAINAFALIEYRLTARRIANPN